MAPSETNAPPYPFQQRMRFRSVLYSTTAVWPRPEEQVFEAPPRESQCNTQCLWQNTQKWEQNDKLSCGMRLIRLARPGLDDDAPWWWQRTRVRGLDGRPCKLWALDKGGGLLRLLWYNCSRVSSELEKISKRGLVRQSAVKSGRLIHIHQQQQLWNKSPSQNECWHGSKQKWPYFGWSRDQHQRPTPGGPSATYKY